MFCCCNYRLYAYPVFSKCLLLLWEKEVDVYFYFFKDFIYFFFRERGQEGEREGEKHQWVIVPHASPTGDPAHNPGMCPDWESNQRSFGSEACAQSTELHQPEQKLTFIVHMIPNSTVKRSPWYDHLLIARTQLLVSLLPSSPLLRELGLPVS